MVSLRVVGERRSGLEDAPRCEKASNRKDEGCKASAVLAKEHHKLLRCRNRGACRRCSLRLPGFPLSNTAAEEFGDLLASLCDLLCIYSGMS